MQRKLHILAIALFGAGLASAQTAEKPVYKVGDKWVFTQTHADGKASRWSREIVEVAPDHLTVRLGAANTAEYDDAMNSAPNGAQNARVLVRYPLKVGDSWSFSRRAGSSGQGEERGNAKVTQHESITVPAGRYECFRIEAESTTATRGVNDQQKWVRWYCPAVKWIAREEIRTVSSRYGQGSSHSEAISELVSFTPGP